MGFDGDQGQREQGDGQPLPTVYQVVRQAVDMFPDSVDGKNMSIIEWSGGHVLCTRISRTIRNVQIRKIRAVADSSLYNIKFKPRRKENDETMTYSPCDDRYMNQIIRSNQSS